MVPVIESSKGCPLKYIKLNNNIRLHVFLSTMIFWILRGSAIQQCSSRDLQPYGTNILPLNPTSPRPFKPVTADQNFLCKVLPRWMDTLSERQLEVIEANPISDRLNAFRAALGSDYPNISHNSATVAVGKHVSDSSE